MTIERDDETRDQLVSQTYRELSTETAPERLNREVLRMAAKDSARQTGLASRIAGWTRPLALAATFALSLAVVLEYSRLPERSLPTSTPELESVSEDFRPKDNSAIEDATNQARLRSGSNRLDTFEPLAEEDVTQDNDANVSPSATPAPSFDAPTVLREQLDVDRSIESSTAVTKSVATELARENETRQLPESQPEELTAADVELAFEQNRSEELSLRSAEAQAVAEFSASPAAITAEKKESGAAQFCDDEVRESADDWMACIKDLRTAEATEAADQEYQQLLLKFPIK